MKKIKLSDENSTIVEIFSLLESGGYLTIQILGETSATLESLFKTCRNIKTIQYYIDDTLKCGYSDYTKFISFNKEINGYTAIDYATVDLTTESKFAETKSDILTITLQKKTESECLKDELCKTNANIAYVAMKAGVTL